MQGLGAPELGLLPTLRSKLAGVILGQHAWHQIFDFLVTGAYKQGWRDGYAKGYDDGALNSRKMTMKTNLKRLALAAIIVGALLLPTQAAAPKTEIGTAWTSAPTTAVELRTQLTHEFAVLKAQFGVDASRLELQILETPPPDNGRMAQTFGDTTIQLFLPVLRAQFEQRSIMERDQIASLSGGRDFAALASATLRHEFAHGVTAARLAAQGKSMAADSPSATSPWPNDPLHGELWARLNASLAGYGSEHGTPYIGFPSELQSARWRQGLGGTILTPNGMSG